MVSWGQFSGSLEFTEGWGFFALSVSLNRFQSLIFHAWVARLNEQICYQLQGVWAYSCWLITLCKHTHTHTHQCTRSCFPLLILLGDPRLKFCLKEPLSWHSLLPAASPRLCNRPRVWWAALGCSAGFCQLKTQKSFVSQGKIINHFLANNIHYFDSCAFFF